MSVVMKVIQIVVLQILNLDSAPKDFPVRLCQELFRASL